VSKVDFAIAGEAGIKITLRARDSKYGWISEWDSTRQPNAQYRIVSIAHDHADHGAQSEALVVHVVN
jgi:hypothetical protein